MKNIPVRKYFFLQILLFNKRTYFFSFLLILSIVLTLLIGQFSNTISYLLILAIIGTLYFTVSSLFFSFLIYDYSDLYKFKWLEKYKTKGTIISIYSGYTEAGPLLDKALPECSIIHLDFFDDNVSITTSIKEAKKLSSAFHSKKIIYNNWKDNQKGNLILFMQSLHELRIHTQQIDCLSEASSHLATKESRIIVVEHLCDYKNFLIYSIGAFHFFGKKRWHNVFKNSGLTIEEELTITPFIKIFILKK